MYKCFLFFYLTYRKAGHILVCSLYDLKHYFDPLIVVRVELYEKDILKVKQIAKLKFFWDRNAPAVAVV